MSCIRFVDRVGDLDLGRLPVGLRSLVATHIGGLNGTLILAAPQSNLVQIDLGLHQFKGITGCHSFPPNLRYLDLSQGIELWQSLFQDYYFPDDESLQQIDYLRERNVCVKVRLVN